VSARRGISWSQLRIGLFVTITVTASSIVVFFIDEFRNAVEDRYTLYFHTFTNQPLNRRAPVWLAGQPVGHIQGLRFAPPGTSQRELLSVELSVSTRARPHITEGAVVQVTSAGLLGEAVVNILPASEPGPTLSDGSVLTAAYVIDPQEAVHHFRSIYDSLPYVRDRWLEVLDQARNGTGSLSQLSRQQGELRLLQANLRALASTFDAFGITAGDLAELVSDPEVRGALDRLGPRIETLADRWGNGEGALVGFVSDTAIAQHIDGILLSADRLSERLETGRGTLGRLMNDRALADEIRRTQQMLRELKGELGAGN
jgi:phospholipid/cholesterol/gamma-HCH transport system substrate-binding protein